VSIKITINSFFSVEFLLVGDNSLGSYVRRSALVVYWAAKPLPTPRSVSTQENTCCDIRWELRTKKRSGSIATVASKTSLAFKVHALSHQGSISTTGHPNEPSTHHCLSTYLHIHIRLLPQQCPAPSTKQSHQIGCHRSSSPPSFPLGITVPAHLP
jgi:hypothetical protein